MRIGHGYDAHRFIDGRDLVLGGVIIRYEKGMEAHSDGDVLIHALCDALLGAAAMGDIGKQFPDSDETYKNMDSRILLRRVVQLLESENYRVSNADITVVAQAPKLADYLPGMIANLADDLQVPVAHINIKATTTEGMGFTGRKEGVAVHAVVLVASSK